MAAAQIQSLLRFLSQDAKIPLASAMGKVIDLQKANLTTAAQISKADIKTLQEIFKDDKVSKQVLNAAKRVSKKREAPSEKAGSPQKKAKSSFQTDSRTPFENECALSLSVSSATEEELSKIVLLTNRAPLVLAFAVCVLKYTMPEQPISSRLSLAQAVVSANSRSKAISLGIESGKSAEQEGWGEGQPVIKVLGREIKVLKRWDYNPREGKPAENSSSDQHARNDVASEDVVGKVSSDESNSTPPLWGVDLEALRSVHRGDMNEAVKTSEALPIFTPDSARSYLYKSFAKEPTENDKSSSTSKKKTVSQLEAEREAGLGHLLRSIDLVCQSWSSTLNREDLDRRAWAWYLRVRPEVQSGAKGWGERGPVKLSDILALKRQS